MLEREVELLKLQRKAGAQLIRNFQPSKRRRSLIVPLLRAAHKLSRPQANAVVGLRNVAGHASVEPDRVLIDLMWRYIARHPYAGFNTLFGVLKYDMPAIGAVAVNTRQQWRQ